MLSKSEGAGKQHQQRYCYPGEHRSAKILQLAGDRIFPMLLQIQTTVFIFVAHSSPTPLSLLNIRSPNLQEKPDCIIISGNQKSGYEKS